MASGGKCPSTILVPTMAPSSCRKQASPRPNSEFPTRLLISASCPGAALTDSGRCSDRSNFGKSLDRVRVVPADGGFPCGRRLRRNVMRVAVETGGVVGQHQVEIGDI